jgi:SAM-dependent methyltransferase
MLAADRISLIAVTLPEASSVLVTLTADELDRLVASGRASVYLDRFLLMPPLDERDHEAAIDAFFSWLADVYEKVIDRQRNVENIEGLQRALLEAGAGAGTLLDFGCGTGLSRLSGVVPHRRVIGFDAAAPMREQARQVGLEVIAPADLDDLPTGSITGAFASYALHLEVHPECVRRCVAAMGKRPLFAANFHKGAGKKWADAIFSELGLVGEPLPQHPSLHGPAILYQRARR